MIAVGEGACRGCASPVVAAVEGTLVEAGRGRLERLSGRHRALAAFFAMVILPAFVGAVAGIVAWLGGSVPANILFASLFFLITCSPGPAMLASAISGRHVGLLGVRTVRHLRRQRSLRRARRQLKLLPSASAQVARRGRVDAGPGVLVATLDLWFGPAEPRPLAWLAVSEGFGIVLDDGQRVDVPAGPLRLEVPAGERRVEAREAVAGVAGVRPWRISVVLAGGDRVEVKGELAVAPVAGGYRDATSRLVPMGLPVVALVERAA
jgi:hypothetical protein